MELLLALLMQSAAASPELAPRLPYASDARQRPAPAGRIDWRALDRSLAGGARRERGSAARAPAARSDTIWNGVPVRIIDGRRHGIW